MKAFWTPQNLGILLVVAGLLWLFNTFYTGRMEKSAAVKTVPPDARTACKILTVYDGDTVGCDLNGDVQVNKPVEEIRFLGVDTPEMHYSRKNRTHGKEDEPFAADASRYTEKRLKNKMAYLEWDTQRTDRHGRSLAHVFLSPTDTVSIGEDLLNHGYATVLFIEPNHRYQERYLKAEHDARMMAVGLWGDWAEDNSD